MTERAAESAPLEYEQGSTAARAEAFPRNEWLARTLLAVSAVALGAAIQTREGLISRLGILLWLNLAVLTCLAAVLLRPREPKSQIARWLLPVVLAIGLAFQFAQLAWSYPGSIWNAKSGSEMAELSRLFDQEPWIKDPAERADARRRISALYRPLRDARFQIGILCAAALAASGFFSRRWLASFGMPLLLALHFALGVLIIRTTPQPYIDVHVFQQESAAALLNGQNPYAITFTNIYGPDAYVYGPGLTANGRAKFGFPYTPLSLYMAVPGYALAGDHRYSQLVALTLAGALIAYSAAGLVPKLAAMLLLFSPRAFMVIEMAWTEPFVIMLLAATVFCACRFPRAAPYVLGLLLASKQYMLFTIPLGLLLLPRPFSWRDYARLMGKALIVTVVVSAPLVFWDLRAYGHSAVMLQFKQPFRNDSLGYLAYLWWSGGPFLKSLAPRLSAIAFLAAVPAIVLAIRRWPSGGGGFAAGVALVYLAFFIFNKQAFCNYYFFVIAAMCCAVAALPGAVEAAQRPASDGAAHT